MKQQHVSCEEGSAEENKLQGDTLQRSCAANLSPFYRQIISLLQEMSWP